jgi:hypothetical protein
MEHKLLFLPTVKDGTRDILVLFRAGDYFIDSTVRFGRIAI